MLYNLQSERDKGGRAGTDPQRQSRGTSPRSSGVVAMRAKRQACKHNHEGEVAAQLVELFPQIFTVLSTPTAEY